MNYTYSAFAIYLLAMLGIGYYFYRKTNTSSDYILGSRNLPPSVAALSSGASDLSGWALMGLPGALFASGLSAVWIVVFTLMGVYLNWKLVAPKLRVATEQLDNSQTIPEYLKNRFKADTKTLQLTASLVMLLFFTLYVAAGLSGGAVLFEKVFNINYHLALLIGGFVIVSYTFMGGYLAVCWTDFFQGIMMSLSLLITALCLFFIFNTPQMSHELSQVLSKLTLKKLEPSDGWLFGLISLSGWCIGYVGQPHVLVRFMSVRTLKDVAVSRKIAMIWSVVTMISAVVVGVLGTAYFGKGLSNPETVFIALAQAFYHPFVAGIIIAGILAAIMSTIDSQLLICSTTISEDLYKTYFRKNAKDKEVILVARIGLLIVALIGLALAFNKADRTLLSMVAFAWGGFGAAFSPVIIFSLFWQSMTCQAAIWGMVIGALISLTWEVLEGGIFDMFGVVPGFIGASMIIVLITLLSKYRVKHQQYN
jgi:sodium/proline symporter